MDAGGVIFLVDRNIANVGDLTAVHESPILTARRRQC
jgi:hypothetical protein